MTKYQLYQHLIDMHGQLAPASPKGWLRDEVDAAHLYAHRSGRVAVPHEHDDDGRGGAS